jgi:2-C-methyl-D-erythritol 2,4-cyclodiphosphate synthase
LPQTAHFAKILAIPRGFRVCRRRSPSLASRDGYVTDGLPHGRRIAITLAARVGIGHDTHRLAPGKPLRLGGVDVPHALGLVGHSDADVLLHAVTDAVLGAASLGDIGEMFPDTAAENRNRDSADMLRLAVRRAVEAGYRVVNVDCIVFAQSPKLSPYKQAIKARIAELLEVTPDCVGVKAKTGELVGPVGREEAMMAECVALLERIGP